MQKKYSIRLKLDVLKELQKNESDAQFSRKLGVSQSTLYRVKLAPTDHRYCSPGPSFIAKMLHTYPYKRFEDLFFFEENLRQR